MIDSDFPKEMERKPLRKKWFMSLPSAYCILTNTYPFEYVELSEDREHPWREFSQENTGRLVHIFSSKDKCLQSMEEMLAFREQAISTGGKLVDTKEIFRTYQQANASLPRDPIQALTFPPGTYSEKLTKRLLLSLPTGSYLMSNTLSSTSMEPLMTAIVPPLSKREGFWLQVKSWGLNGRTFQIEVREL